LRAKGHVDLAAQLGLEVLDPNNDGKLRLDEIFDITNDFHDSARLFCILDVQGNASVNVGGSATAFPGTPFKKDFGSLAHFE